jgi:hypothetical protein
VLTFLTARSDRGRSFRRASSPSRILISVFQRLVQVCLPTVFDRLDEGRARQRRQDFGRRGRLLSWHRDSDGSWRARLSCAELPRTVERAGRSRIEAIDRADHGLKQILNLRQNQNMKSRSGWTVRPHDGVH